MSDFVIIILVNLSLFLISLGLTTRFLYDIGCKGCQQVEITEYCEEFGIKPKRKFL